MKKGITMVFSLAIASLAITFISITGYSQTYDKDYLDGLVYFKFKDNVNVDIPVHPDKSVDLAHFPFLQPMIETYGITGISRPFDFNDDFQLLRTYEISFSRFSIVEEMISELAANHDLEYVEKVPLYYIDYTPNDTLYNRLFGFGNWNWHLDVVNAEMAWDVTTGDPEINVAIVDNAVWIDHPDLTNKIYLSYDVTQAGNNNSNPPSTGDPGDWSHGTHTAGLAAAETDNVTGVASIGYNVSLIGVKASTNNSPTGITHWTAGIQWAANNGANVISMSFGGSGYSQTSQNLINSISNNGVVFFASAGNNNTSTPHYPSAYANVISVASTNENDIKSDFSNFGTTIDICAPGGYGISGPSGLLSSTYAQTDLGYYDTYYGTSMSCPFAAGLGGLILSINPDLTPQQVENVLKSTCVVIDTLAGNASWAGLLGAGRIDAYAAVTNTPFTPVADFVTEITTIMPGTSIQFLDKTAGVPNTWAWEFTGGNPYLSGQPNPTVLYANEGVYNVSLAATNSFGMNVKTKTGYITVTSTPDPWIIFSASEEYACNKDVITFTDQTLYDPTSWDWAFDPPTVAFVNGTTANSQNPEVRFDEPGFYTVTLSATNANGSSNKTVENMIEIEGLLLNYAEDFEEGNSGNLVLGANTRGKAAVDSRAAAPGSGYGLHFHGNHYTGGWSGGPSNTTPTQAWETNTNFHSWAENCSVDATGIEGVGLTFDLRQTFSIGTKYSWFRVLVNDEQVADVYGNENFNPVTNQDPFQNMIFDLSEYGNSFFSLKFQAACYLVDKFFAEGDNAFVDNIMISNTTAIGEPGNSEPGMLIYPNPVSGLLNYSAHSVGSNTEVKVMNVQGQTILRKQESNYRNGEIRRADLTGIAPGIYILQVSGEKGVATKKIIVK
ncbi:MAG: S8 family serine peptidase [Bacteroidales bacterium]|nr:S8 family serine peptidase [Bacteroidales bacterium]